MTGQNKSYAFLVTEEMDGRRADDVLRAVFGVSDRQIRALKRQKGILLDGKSVYANACVCKGQELEMLCEDEYDQGIVPQEGPLEIVYEDEELLISRINEAAKYVPLENLYLSPQCGFASCEIGNKLTEDEQWAKIALVKHISERVWK